MNLDLQREQEETKADATYGPFTSTHEGFGVLAEEVSELLDAIRANSRQAVIDEAIQVAAVAMRMARGAAHDAAFGRRSNLARGGA